MPKQILNDSASLFTSQTLKDFIDASVIHIVHARVKHAQTICMVETSQQRFKVNVDCDSPQRDRYVNFALLLHNKTYH